MPDGAKEVLTLVTLFKKNDMTDDIKIFKMASVSYLFDCKLQLS